MKKNYFAMLLFVCLGFFQAGAQTWEPVGPATGVSTGGAGRMNLITDYQGNLLVGYYDAAATKGNVQKYSNGAWSYLDGNANGVTSGFATYSSLAADAQGAVYFTNPDSGMQVRKFSGGSWTQLANATNNIINFHASAVSADNVLFVASSDATGTIKRYVNGAWEQVGNTGFFGGASSYLDMVIGTDGFVYISFNNNGYVHVYKNSVTATTADNWQSVGNVNLAAASSSENYNSSLAIDANNNLYLAYVSGSAGGNKLNVKKYSAGAWSQLGAENFTSQRIQHASIAVSGNGAVYVGGSIWEDADFLKNFVMAYNEGSNTWSQLGGFIAQGQATFNSLTVGTDGLVYAAFSDSGLAKLSVKKFVTSATVPVTGVDVTVANAAPATITTNGGTLQLVAAVLPANATNSNVTWAITSGAGFATISPTGLVTATANGTITVTVTTADGSHTDTITIVITGQTVAATGVDVSVANAAPATITTNGGTLQLVAAVLPANATNSTVTWAITSGAGFATISPSGLVTATANGTITVTVTTADGNHTDTINIVITGQVVAATGVDVSVANAAPATITTNGGTLQLVAAVLPANATNSNVTWAITSGAGFATISPTGLVTASANGTITVTVTTADGNHTDTIEVVITGQLIAITAVTVTVAENAVPAITTVGGTLQLVATVTPENATDTDLVWSITSGSEFATVSQEGVVTAVANGTVIIRATAADGTVYGEITITVNIPTSGIDGFNKNTLSVYPNPTNDMLHIVSDANVSVTLYDSLGREVLHTTAQSVNMSALSSGIYILNATFENGSSESIRVIKQ